jgi:hypothetical protein
METVDDAFKIYDKKIIDDRQKLEAPLKDTFLTLCKNVEDPIMTKKLLDDVKNRGPKALVLAKFKSFDSELRERIIIMSSHRKDYYYTVKTGPFYGWYIKPTYHVSRYYSKLTFTLCRVSWFRRLLGY